MEQKILVTGYKSYSFDDEKTGKKFQGVKISYLSNESAKDNEVGFLPIQTTLPYEFLKKLDGSGSYKVLLTVTSGAGNKPNIEISDIEFIAPIDFRELI